MATFLVYQLQQYRGITEWPADYEPSAAERRKATAWQAIRIVGCPDRRADAYAVDATNPRDAIVKVRVRIEGDAARLVAAQTVTVTCSSIGVRTKRDRLYDLLRDAGPDGLKLSDIPLDLPCPAVHMQSLEFEGHRIADHSGPDPVTRRFERRWVLVKDAWA